MRCDLRNLSTLAYAQGNRHWQYRCRANTEAPATMAEVQAPGFFKDIDMIAGDTIMCACANGGVLLYVTGVVDGVMVVPMCATRVLA